MRPSSGGELKPVALARIWTTPPRPRLPENADTNDSRAYQTAGHKWIWLRPDVAAAAFYWASRLDPWPAEPYYARSVALLLSTGSRDPRSHSAMWRPRRRLQPEEVRIIDSLNQTAVERDPFLWRRYDVLLTGRPPASVRHRMRDAASAGYWALDAGEYAEAAEKLGKALARQPQRLSLRLLRAHAFYALQQYDSAADQLRVLTDTLSARETRELRPVYMSKALLYQAQGLVYTKMQDTISARRAFEQAVSENLVFYMAHVQLAQLALDRHDIQRLMTEMERALLIRGEDPALRLYFGYVLGELDRVDQSIEQFRLAIASAPDYALPYYHLGRALQTRADTAGALVAYDAYLTRAPREDAVRKWVSSQRDRLARRP